MGSTVLVGSLWFDQDDIDPHGHGCKVHHESSFTCLGVLKRHHDCGYGLLGLCRIRKMFSYIFLVDDMRKRNGAFVAGKTVEDGCNIGYLSVPELADMYWYYRRRLPHH